MMAEMKEFPTGLMIRLCYEDGPQSFASWTVNDGDEAVHAELCRRINSHDKLLQTLIEIRDKLDDEHSFYEWTDVGIDEDSGDTVFDYVYRPEEVEDAVKKIDDAIKATKQ